MPEAPQLPTAVASRRNQNSRMGDGSKKYVFVIKKTFFRWGVQVGQKQHLFVNKKNFLSVYGVPLVWRVSIWSKKTFICSKKTFFACPWVPSSLESYYSGQKKQLLLVNKTFLCVHGAPPVWKASTGECPRGPCSLENVNLGQKKHFL